MDAEQYARNWVARNKDAITPLMERGYELRKVAIRHLAIDDKTGGLKAGLPGMYVVAGAAHDRDCYEIAEELVASGAQQSCGSESVFDFIRTGKLAKPAAPRGRQYGSAGRDFVLVVLVAELQELCPDLPLGSNDATDTRASATEIALRTLEAAGFEVLDGKKPPGDLAVPEHRSVEKALRRFHRDKKIPELFF